jgi:hypothetical protein
MVRRNMRVFAWIIPVVLIVAGLSLLARTLYVSQRDIGWYILPGLPLLGVGAAGLLIASSARRAVRILASVIVISTGLLLAFFGATDRLLAPDDPWHTYYDSRPLSVTVGIVLALGGVAWSYNAIKSVGPPNNPQQGDGAIQKRPNGK